MQDDPYAADAIKTVVNAGRPLQWFMQDDPYADDAIDTVIYAGRPLCY